VLSADPAAQKHISEAVLCAVCTCCLHPTHTGQGPAKTRLVFPQPLSSVLGAGTYTYGPAFIQFNGANWLNAQALLATVTAVSCTCDFETAQSQHCSGSTTRVSAHTYTDRLPVWSLLCVLLPCVLPM
jgi:hypothetical protein